MTALETLQKYNLKTDVKSIIERINANEYQYIAQEVCDEHTPQSARLFGIARDLRIADLALLCSLAEKGERYEKAVKSHRSELEPHRHIDVCAPYAIRELDEIITEAEGESK